MDDLISLIFVYFIPSTSCKSPPPAPYLGFPLFLRHISFSPISSSPCTTSNTAITQTEKKKSLHKYTIKAVKAFSPSLPSSLCFLHPSINSLPLHVKRFILSQASPPISLSLSISHSPLSGCISVSLSFMQLSL